MRRLLPPAPATRTRVDSNAVTDHRMACSLLSPAADGPLGPGVRYTGSPSEFAWVLPVKAGARIELSQDAWIAALDASTQTVIQGPTPNCGPAPIQNTGGGGGGCGFGSSDNAASPAGFSAASDADGGAGPAAVQVVSESVVGPYDAVTVRSSQGEALGDWLRANGYAVPESIQPTIDAFTNGGFDFNALKLRPGEGVQAMQPVRVVTPGADPYLPLRMVAAGVGANVGIELFILSEGRYHLQNFQDATIDFSKLVWDPYNNVSNYETLASAAMAANGGASWLTESSAPADLNTNYFGSYGNYGSTNPPLAGAYTYTCNPLMLPPPANCGASQGDDGGDEASAVANDADTEAGDDGSSSSASDSATPATDAATDSATSATDAAVDSGSAVPEASTPAPLADGGSCASTTVPCDDLQLAMTGITTGDLWVTRLRAFLPASALAADIVLEASPSQAQVSSFHETSTYSDPSYNPCPNSSAAPAGGGEGGCACRTTESASASPRNRYADAFLFGVGAVFLGLSLRRRRRR